MLVLLLFSDLCENFFGVRCFFLSSLLLVVVVFFQFSSALVLFRSYRVYVHTHCSERNGPEPVCTGSLCELTIRSHAMLPPFFINNFFFRFSFRLISMNSRSIRVPNFVFLFVFFFAFVHLIIQLHGFKVSLCRRSKTSFRLHIRDFRIATLDSRR